MKIINVTQGCAEWHSYRAKHFNASDCPAMLGISSYKSRDALLKEKATGISPEIDANTQRIFNKGHEYEEMARPLAEAFLGDELFPIVASLDVDGLPLSASLDGLTMTGETAWEHKTLNQKIEDAVLGGEIPEQYRAQMEMQLLVSGAERCLFMASRGTADTEIHKWYESDPVMRDRIIAGWKQFAIDLANYVLPEAEAPAAVAELMPALPTISYNTEFTGTTLALHSNLEGFKAGVAKLAELSKVKLETDQDFANAIARIKICEDAEARIALVKSMVIGEVASIDMFTKELDALDKVLSQIRLGDKKQVDKRKEEIKLEVITSAQAQWTEHLNAINSKLDGVTLPHVTINLQGAIKNLRTISSLKSKANDELARAKIEANQLAEKITNNIQLLRMIAGEYMELFADLQTICVKDADYIKAIAKQRVDQHKADEQVRIQAEAKRMADEQIERDRQAELAKAQAAAVEAVKPLETERLATSKEIADFVTNKNQTMDLIPPDYEQYATNTKHFDQSFEQVFGGNSAEPMVDLSDFQKGRAEGFKQGLELALKIFAKSGSAGFAKAVQDFIEVGAPEAVSKAA